MLATTHPNNRIANPDVEPRTIRVAGLARSIHVKIASHFEEWEQAYRLTSKNYQAQGYEPLDATAVRFTPHHALPDTVTFVAKEGETVVATMSLVPDNTFLGLPLESIFGREIAELRADGRHLGETTCLTDKSLSAREFLQVFLTLIQLNMQYHVAQGGDSWVIAVNPRHGAFYQKVLGFVPLGTSRAYPAVRGHPARAFLLDLDLMKARAEKMHQRMFAEPLAEEVLHKKRLSPTLSRYFARCSSQAEYETIDEILATVAILGGTRRW